MPGQFLEHIGNIWGALLAIFGALLPQCALWCMTHWLKTAKALC